MLFNRQISHRNYSANRMTHHLADDQLVNGKCVGNRVEK